MFRHASSCQPVPLPSRLQITTRHLASRLHHETPRFSASNHNIPIRTNANLGYKTRHYMPILDCSPVLRYPPLPSASIDPRPNHRTTLLGSKSSYFNTILGFRQGHDNPAETTTNRIISRLHTLSLRLFPPRFSTARQFVSIRSSDPQHSDSIHISASYHTATAQITSRLHSEPPRSFLDFMPVLSNTVHLGTKYVTYRSVSYLGFKIHRSKPFQVISRLL